MTDAADDRTADDLTADVKDDSPDLFELARVVTVSGALKRRLQQARLDLEKAAPSGVAKATGKAEHLASLDRRGELLQRRRSLFLAAEAAAHLPHRESASPGANLIRRLQGNLAVVLQHGHSLHKVRALRALHHVPSVRCLPALEDALRDDSPWVQATALRTFLGFDLDEADPRRALRRFLWRSFGTSFRAESTESDIFFHLLSGVVNGARQQRAGWSILLLALTLGLVRGFCRLLMWGLRAVLVVLAFLLFGGALHLVFALIYDLWEWVSGSSAVSWLDSVQKVFLSTYLVDTLLILLVGALSALAHLGHLKLPWNKCWDVTLSTLRFFSLSILLVLAPLGQLKQTCNQGAKIWITTLARSLGGLTLDGALIALAWLKADSLHVWPLIVFGFCQLFALALKGDLDNGQPNSPRWIGRGVLFGYLAYYQGCSPSYPLWIVALTLHIVPIWWAHWPDHWKGWRAGHSVLGLIGMGIILALMPMLLDILVLALLGGITFGLLTWIHRLGQHQVPWLRTYLLSRHPRHFNSRHHFIAYILSVARDSQLPHASRARSVRRLVQLHLADPHVVARLIELASEPDLPPIVRDAVYQVVDTIERRIQQGQSTPISDALELPETPRLPATAPMLRRPILRLLALALLPLAALTGRAFWSGGAGLWTDWALLGLAWTALTALVVCSLTVGRVSAWRRAGWVMSCGTLGALLGRRFQAWTLETQTAATWPSLCAETPFLVDWPSLSSLLLGGAFFFLGGLLGEVIHRLEGERQEAPSAPLGTPGWTLVTVLSSAVLVLQSVPLETYLELRHHGPTPKVTAASEDGNRWWIDLPVQDPRAVRLTVMDLPVGVDRPSRVETFPWTSLSSWEAANAGKSDAERAIANLAASWIAFTPGEVRPLLDQGCAVSAVAATSVVHLDLTACPPPSGRRHLAVMVLGPHRSRFLMDQLQQPSLPVLEGPHRHHGSLTTVTDHLIWFPLQPDTPKCCKSI